MDIETLKKHVAYDPSTGEFTWRVSNRGHRRAGDPAGSHNAYGYRRIKIAQRTYLAHRLAWAFLTGGWPSAEIDHVNGKRDDNRAVNLREATRQPNCQNVPGAGVRFEPDRGKWLARICVNGRQKNLGRFDTRGAAEAAYAAAKAEHRGEFARAPV